MDILKALSLVESAGNRPLDQLAGDIQPSGVADPSGGATGLGADARRPADQAVGDPPDAPKVPIQDVTPDNVIPESMSGKFEHLMNENIKGFKVDVSGAAAKMFESIDLDEEFAAKALSIFESAVNESAAAHLKSINKLAGRVIERVITARVSQLEEQAERHMNHAITEWTQENRLAIEQGVRVQVAESFMEGIKELLESHYVDLPAGKKDLYEAAIEKGDEILSKFNEERQKNVVLESELTSLKKTSLIEKATRGMVATKADKFRKLAEEIEFNSSFATKLESLREEAIRTPIAAQPAPSQSLTEDVSPLVNALTEERREAVADKMVESYLGFMNRQ